MRNVVFVAPFFREETLRFVGAVAGLPGVRLALLSQDPASALPPGIRGRLAGHLRLDDALDPVALREAVAVVGRGLGGVERLLGTLEELQVPLGRIRDELGIPGMGTEAARNFRDKGRMKEVLTAAGLPCARFRVAPSAAEVRRFVEEVDFPVVVKPPEGSGARGTFRVDGAEQLEGLLRSVALSPERPALLEEFLTGEEHSFDSVCVGGRMVWHSINVYRPSPLEVLREPWIQWCVLSPREVDGPRWSAILEAAPPALRALGLETGLSHMEWFLRPDGRVAISEVAARPPGARFTTLISHAHAFDLHAAWARLVVFGEFDPPSRRYAVGAAYLRGQGAGRVARVEGLERVGQELGGLVVEARLPGPGQPASGTYEGEGVVIVRHPETAVVEQALRTIVSTVRVRLE